jgi:hypothetical protein
MGPDWQSKLVSPDINRALNNAHNFYDPTHPNTYVQDPYATPSFTQPPKRDDNIGFLKSVSYGYQLDNEIHAAYQLLTDPDFEEEDGYDISRDPQLTGFEPHLFKLLDSRSRAETAHRIERINHENKMRQELDKSGGAGFFGRLVGGVGPIDIAALLAPIPGLTAATNTSRVNRMLRAGAGMSLITAPEEVLLHVSQEDRPAAETWMGLGATALMGMGLGAVIKPKAPKTKITKEDIEDAERMLFEHKETLSQHKAYSEEGINRSAGAQGVNRVVTEEDIAAEMVAETLKETGIKLEKLNFNPMLRLLNSPFRAAQEVVSDLVPLGGMVQKKTSRGVAQSVSVETEFEREFMHTLADNIRFIDDAYLSYRGNTGAGQRARVQTTDDGVVNLSERSDFSRTLETTKLQAMDAWDNFQSRHTHPQIGQRPLSHAEFREAVGKAMRRNDDASSLNIPDAVKPHVNSAAQKIRKDIFDNLGRQAHEVGLFERAFENQKHSLLKKRAGLQAEFRAMQQQFDDVAAEDIADEIARLTTKIEEVEGKIDGLIANGVTQNTAPSYVSRLWRHDIVTERYDELSDVLKSHYRRQREYATLTEADLNQMVEEIIEHGILRDKPYLEIRGADDLLDGVEDVGFMRERMLDIPDDLVEDFIESDIEAIIRHYQKSVGTDVILARRFGDPSMRSVIEMVTEEAEEKIAQATTRQERTKIRKDLELSINDIRGLRDRLRGTYGLPKDPYRPISRAVRIGKIWSVLTMGGGFAISAIPDVARVVMTEGLDNAIGNGLRHFMSEQGRIAIKMSKKELQLAGTGLDMVLGTRALQFADIGDMYGRKFGFERGLMRAQGAYFIANGLHSWNTGMKTFAGTVTGMRISEDVLAWKAGRLTQRGKEKLLRHGIDDNMAHRIALQIEEHGERINGHWLPNTELWTDAATKRAYRDALNQDVNRTIITPGAGDRALWTSTEFGSMIAQFKSFGQSALPKMLISGMQESDAAFYQGLTFLVGLGALTNEIKRLQYGDTRKRSFTENLIDAIDRSGSLAIFMDINNAVEKISNFQAGLRPITGNSPPYDVSAWSMAGLLGPTASNAATLTRVAGDVIGADVDAQTMRQIRKLVPGQNHPLIDPILDSLN